MGIQEGPNVNADDEALKPFRRSITKQSISSEMAMERINRKIKQQFWIMLGTPKKSEDMDFNVEKVEIMHYLPHHGVLTPDKSTTNLRIVYDASAYLQGKKSLNEVLYRGPNDEFNERIAEYDQPKTIKNNFLGINWIGFQINSSTFMEPEQDTQESASFLIYTKSRIAPIKGIFTPRLKFVFAVLVSGGVGYSLCQ
ncbi:unnamed protein product [Dracunculus medinensis]|uniref:DUF1524 domain-containing protein n=1 Tax=Dracunculus medinensis TaxID=318479 RepID=A0A0N4US16_DRAME|nr:unnamed protein product [Dracunculus medinensis]